MATTWLAAPRQVETLIFVKIVSKTLTKINIEYEKWKNTSFVKQFGVVVTARTVALVNDGSPHLANWAYTHAVRYPKGVRQEFDISLPEREQYTHANRPRGAKDLLSPFPPTRAAWGAQAFLCGRVAAEGV